MNTEKIEDVVKNHKIIEAVFVEGHIVYLVVNEHNDEAYEAASVVDQRLGSDDVDIRIRAHQGKGVDALSLGRWAKRVL